MTWRITHITSPGRAGDYAVRAPSLEARKLAAALDVPLWTLR